MTDTESVAVEDKAEAQETPVQEVQSQEEQPQEAKQVQEEKTVPLSALQKERRKRQEAEEENKAYREAQLKQMQSQPQEEDESKYDPVTKGDMGKHELAIIQAVEEKRWIKENPEKAAIVNERLKDFLKERPNLTTAISTATNRYEEAFEFLDKLTPSREPVEKKQVKQEREAPGSPSGVSKAAGLAQSANLMGMDDSEFLAWRKSKSRGR
jgi:hypothetical protein